jgi:hypothetical protein
MRLRVLAASTVLVLSTGVYAQSAPQALPKCMEDAPPISADVTEVSIAKVLPFLGAGCGVEIRVEGIEGTGAVRNVPRLQIQQTRIADIFRFLLQPYGLKYTVLDEKTILVTRQ